MVFVVKHLFDKNPCIMKCYRSFWFSIGLCNIKEKIRAKVIDGNFVFLIIDSYLEDVVCSGVIYKCCGL